MTLEELLPKQVYLRVRRAGIRTVDELIEEVNSYGVKMIKHIRDIGLSQYYLIEYLVKVELP